LLAAKMACSLSHQAIRNLRVALKVLKRRYRLRVVTIRET